MGVATDRAPVGWAGNQPNAQEGAQMFDLNQAVTRWTQSAGTAQTRFTEGVQSTTVDPTQLAIAAQAKLLQGFNEAVQSGRWARNLAQVGAGGWKQATLAKANNYSTGIAAGAGKYQSAM